MSESKKRDQWTKWRWDQLRSLGQSRIVQLTFLVPVIGYFIIFGESFNEYLRLTFSNSADPSSTIGISYWRAYFLYFGFSFVALASLLFSIFCPESVKLHGAAYEFVDREAETVSKYREATMQDALDRRNYEIVRANENYPKYEDANDLAIEVEGDWLTVDHDDPSFEAAAKALAGVKKSVRDLDRAGLMTEYFVLLKSASPVARMWVSIFYAVGIALVSVPTLVVFGEVVVAAVEAFMRFLVGIFG